MTTAPEHGLGTIFERLSRRNGRRKSITTLAANQQFRVLIALDLLIED